MLFWQRPCKILSRLAIKIINISIFISIGLVSVLFSILGIGIILIETEMFKAGFFKAIVRSYWRQFVVGGVYIALSIALAAVSYVCRMYICVHICMYG